MSNLPENMNSEVARKLLKVGEIFRIPGPFFSYEEIKMGNVNHTFKVNYDQIPSHLLRQSPRLSQR